MNQCNYSEKEGHIEYKKIGDKLEKIACRNQNTCELNPKSSRYKTDLEKKRNKKKESEELRVQEYVDGTIVQCNKKNCKYFDAPVMRIIEDVAFRECSHGVPHPWTGSCKMECPRYPVARCIPKGG